MTAPLDTVQRTLGSEVGVHRPRTHASSTLESDPTRGMPIAFETVKTTGALWGFYHSAAGSPFRDAAVVLCNPLGYEAICVHRAYRAWAEHLARAGFAVLRFDYHGTGDSASDDSASDRVTAWLSSIDAAADLARTLSGARSICLVGTRLGALLAAQSSVLRSDVSAVVLLAPFSNGRQFARELRALRLVARDGEGADTESRHEEAAGFVFSESTLLALKQLDASTLAPPCPALIVPRDDIHENLHFVERWQSRGATAEIRRARGYRALMQDPHLSEVPIEIMEATTQWLVDRHPAGARIAARPKAARNVAMVSTTETTIYERALCFGPRGNLYGILTEPTSSVVSGPSRADTAVILLNPGAIHRVGMNRMYPVLARRWAMDGMSTFRMDISGIGDSATQPGLAENKLYSTHAVIDVRAAMDELARLRGYRRFILMGLCSGAYAAYHTALADGRVAGVVLMNPQTFAFEEGQSLVVRRRSNFKAARYYRRSIARWGSWKRLFSGKVDVLEVLRVFALRSRILVARSIRTVAQRLRRVAPTELAKALEALAGRGTDLCFIYSKDDPGLEYLVDHVGSRLNALKRRKNVRFHIIVDADHTFTPVATQKVLADLITGYLRQ